MDILAIVFFIFVFVYLIFASLVAVNAIKYSFIGSMVKIPVFLFVIFVTVVIVFTGLYLTDIIKL